MRPFWFCLSAFVALNEAMAGASSPPTDSEPHAAPWSRDWEQERDQRLDAVLRWELGQALLEKGWFERAAVELEKVRRVIPYDSRVEALLGTAYLMSGEGRVGEKRLEAALSLDPGSSEIGALLGNLRIRQGDWRKGCGQLEAILFRDPEWRQLRLTLIETYLDQGEARKAGPHLKLLQPPMEFEAGTWHLLYARYWAELGDFAAACDHAAAALAAEPTKPVCRREFGLALMRVNRPAEAIPHLARALSAGLKDPELLFSLGEAYFRERHWEDAERIWSGAARLYPVDLTLRLRLLDYYLQSARPERAEALLAGPEWDADVQLLRGHYERKMGRFPSASRALAKATLRTRGERLSLARWEEASLHFDCGRFKEFDRSTDRLLQSGFRVAEVYLLKAQAAIYRHDRKAARRFLENARQADPFAWERQNARLGRISPAASGPLARKE